MTAREWDCSDCGQRSDRPTSGLCPVSEGGEEPHRWKRHAGTLAGIAESMTAEDLREMTAIRRHLEQGEQER